MNTYLRALKHIDMSDVKQKHHQKLIEKKIQEENEKKEKEFIDSIMEVKRYDWRKKLNEGMTSSGVFFSTLPATGDIDLKAISGGDSSSFDPTFSDGVDFGASGSGSGRMGGFNVGANYLKFSQTPDAANDRTAGTIQVDTSTYTTITISAIVGNNSNGGVSPTANLSVFWFSATDAGILGQIPSNGGSLTDYSFTLPSAARGQDIEIILYEPDVPEQKTQYIGQSIPSLHPSTWNDEVAGWANGILSKSNPTADDFDYYGGSAWAAMQQQYYHDDWPAGAPGYPAPVSGLTNATTQADRIAIGQAIYNAFGSGSSTRYPLTYGITNIGYRRLTPVNVFVSLDSPEASSFIRTDPAFSGLSEEEKLKKLKKMIEASDEYVTKMFGSNFPGTGAVAPGKYDPFAQAPPGKAGDIPGVSVSTPPSYLYPGGLVTSGKVTGLTPIRQVYPSQSQSQPQTQSRTKKINFTHTYDVVTDSGTEKRTMDLSTTVPLDAKGNLVNPFGDESQKNTTTSSEQQSQIQKAVLSNPEVANAVEKLGTAGKTYLDYLTNNLPDVIDNNYLGQKYVNSVFKNAFINRNGTVSVGDNIVGTGGKATYDPKTNKVSIPFNYDFKTNDQEFSDPSKAGINDFHKAMLNALGPYSSDAQPQIAQGDPFTAIAQSSLGVVFGALIGASKTFGGAQYRPGNVTMDADELKTFNPALYNRVMKEYNRVVKEEVIVEKRKLKSPKEVLNKIPGYYDGKPSPLGFPMDEPPKTINGYHPDLVDGKKVADRFNRLDPISAKAMPLTGNPHIDKKVKAARKVKESKKSDWRKSLIERKKDYFKMGKIEEQMTTTDVFYSTLPATGDVDLANPPWNILGGQNYNLSDGTLTITGNSGEITDGVVASFDSSLYSNLVFDVSISGDTLLGVFPSGSGGPLLIAQSSGTYSVNITQSSALTLLFVAPGLASGNVSINNLRFQRRTPISVFVPLDSPEAVSFIRTGSGDLSPEEKQKQVKEMLQASDEYVQQMYGDDFPGTGAVPPGESGDTPGVEIAQIQPFAQQQKGTTGVGVPGTKELPGPRPALPGKMNYPPEWTQWKNA